MFLNSNKFNSLFPNFKFQKNLSYEISSNQLLINSKNLIISNENFYSIKRNNKEISVFDIQKNQEISIINSNQNKFTDMCFSNWDDQFLITSNESKIKGWKINPKNQSKPFNRSKKIYPIFDLNAHNKEITSFSFHPSCSNLFASSSFDNSFKIWDLNQQETVLDINSLENSLLNFKKNFPDFIHELYYIPSRICWLGNSEMFLITGKQNDFLSFSIYDSRKLENQPIQSFEIIESQKK
ncbi:coronin [Anaeramoeba ignava]|uniref:Coronin n=1 Tax=Anaeramoeba ignava TaxID=1746090 RepID=A0A9Q0LJZ6_ANAIG|nr:coronin [Anaeramoeba ignava]